MRRTPTVNGELVTKQTRCFCFYKPPGGATWTGCVVSWLRGDARRSRSQKSPHVQLPMVSLKSVAPSTRIEHTERLSCSHVKCIHASNVTLSIVVHLTSTMSNICTRVRTREITPNRGVSGGGGGAGVGAVAGGAVAGGGRYPWGGAVPGGGAVTRGA